MIFLDGINIYGIDRIGLGCDLQLGIVCLGWMVKNLFNFFIGGFVGGLLGSWLSFVNVFGWLDWICVSLLGSICREHRTFLDLLGLRCWSLFLGVKRFRWIRFVIGRVGLGVLPFLRFGSFVTIFYSFLICYLSFWSGFCVILSSFFIIWISFVFSYGSVDDW
jgi:hypothetical protein